MFVSLNLWPSLKSYLVIEKKLSDKSSSLWALKSRFNKLSKYFYEVDFNKKNFNVFIAKMKDDGYAPSYINNLIKMAKHVDKFLELDELSNYGYFRESYTPTKDVLTPEEIKQLAELKMNYKFTQLINDRQKALIYLLGTTGCRIGEAIDLLRSDVVNDHVIFRRTKNGDSRMVPISSDLSALLMSLPVKRDEIFSSYRGGKLSSADTNSDLQKRAKVLGIEKHVYNHLFRHSFITTMLEVGVDSLDVAVIVGHKDPKNTMRYKNSLLSHYKKVIQLHPLLKKTVTFKQMTSNLSNIVRKLVDIENCKLNIIEDSDRLVVELIRI